MSQLLRFAGFLIVCFFFSLNVPAQSRWTFVGITDDYSFWYVDETVQKKSAKVVSAWEKVIHEDKSYSLALSEWKCSAKKKRLMQVHNFAPSGDALSRGTRPLPWRYVVPDSVEEKTSEIVCNSDERKIGKLNKEDPTAKFLTAWVIVKATDLMSKPDPGSDIVREVSSGEKFIMVSNQAIGDWYLVLDLKTNSRGWLNVREVKLIEAKKTLEENKMNRK